MTGFEWIKKQMEGQEDPALNEVVRYLLTRDDMESKYLNEEKSIEGMCKYIKQRGMKNAKNGWNFVENEIVFSWAIMYFTLPNSILKIQPNNKKKETKKSETQKNNVISIDKIKKEKKNNQLSLFGGDNDE